MSVNQHNGPNRILRLLSAVFGPFTGRNVLVWCALIAAIFTVRWALFEPFSIPSGSMEPTLHGDPRFMRGDRIAVNKFVYGLRFPFMNKRIFEGKDPDRWDIVVFKTVEQDASAGTLVKRVVGLPGERIQIRDGVIYADGKPLELPSGMPDIHYTMGPYPDEASVQADVEQLPVSERGAAAQARRRSYERMQGGNFRYGVLPTAEFSVVPEGHYLVLGDNSGHSRDGRVFGWLPKDHIVGRVFCTWWPVNRWRDFTGFSSTWTGRAMLYGAPSLLALYEVSGYFRRKRQRV